MRQYDSLLILTHEERDQLERWARSRSLPSATVFRACLILFLADGVSYRVLEKKLDTTAPTIARWRQRFEQHRIAGLKARHKGSRPRVVTAAVQARIVRRTLQAPPDGSTHWTCRKLATTLGVSKSSVQRVWRKAQLKPHRLERYMASDDPEFESKAADIIGLYLTLGAQDPSRRGIPPATSQGAVPFHADLLFVAQSGRTILFVPDDGDTFPAIVLTPVFEDMSLLR